MNSAARVEQLVVGTRGSPLALAQAREVASLITVRHPALEVEIRVIRTLGDSGGEAPAEGSFTAELERALLDGRCDLAVHSAKDLPVRLAEGLAVAAYPPREDAADALISCHGDLSALPRGARVGTSSPRRRAQLLRVRGDLEVVPMRGNLDTRLGKVRGGEVHAAVVALAGLRRLGLADDDDGIYALPDMLPAPGQGALAVEAAAGSAAALLVSDLDHAPTRAAVEAERALLRRLGAGCGLPLAARATCDGTRLLLTAAVFSADGRREVRAMVSGEAADPEALGARAADELVAGGAAELMGAGKDG